MRDALASRFEPGFFSCPKIEEANRFEASRHAPEQAALSRAKETSDELIHRFRGVNAFDVYADRSRTADGQKGEGIRMSQIELEPMRIQAARQSRLSVVSLDEFDLPG